MGAFLRKTKEQLLGTEEFKAGSTKQFCIWGDAETGGSQGGEVTFDQPWGSAGDGAWMDGASCGLSPRAQPAVTPSCPRSLLPTQGSPRGPFGRGDAGGSPGQEQW